MAPVKGWAEKGFPTRKKKDSGQEEKVSKRVDKPFLTFRRQLAHCIIMYMRRGPKGLENFQEELKGFRKEWKYLQTPLEEVGKIMTTYEWGLHVLPILTKEKNRFKLGNKLIELRKWKEERIDKFDGEEVDDASNQRQRDLWMDPPLM